MKSHLRFVILPFFTLCRIHCLSICLKLNVMSVVWINFYECEVCMGIKKERSNIINHCVCIRMSGYWLIIFNFVIFSLITQWFFSARLEDEKCSSKWNQNTILVWQEEDYWIEIKMLMQLTMILSIFLSFHEIYRSLEPRIVSMSTLWERWC